MIYFPTILPGGSMYTWETRSPNCSSNRLVSILVYMRQFCLADCCHVYKLHDHLPFHLRTFKTKCAACTGSVSSPTRPYMHSLLTERAQCCLLLLWLRHVARASRHSNVGGVTLS